MNLGIGFNRDIGQIRCIADNYFLDKNIEIKYYNNSRHAIYIEKTNKKNFYNMTTSMILDIIINVYSKDMIMHQVDNIPREYNSWEKKKITEICEEILNNKDNFIIEKEHIYKKIKNHIENIPFIWIDGFINFRLKEFNVLIDMLIEKGIKEFNAEKEYKEFIKVLQYFIDAQEPKYNLVNLIIKDDYYELYDETNNVIDKDFFKEVIEEIGSENISRSDLLISTLIVIAPKRLRIHLNKKERDKDVMKIITSVFEDRIYYCYGCNKCNKSIKTRKN